MFKKSVAFFLGTIASAKQSVKDLNENYEAFLSSDSVFANESYNQLIADYFDSGVSLVEPSNERV